MGLYFRRFTSLATTLTFILSGLGTVAPSAHAEDVCALAPGVCTDLNNLEREVSECASLSSQYLCGAVISLVFSEVDPIEQTALREAEECASLQTQYLCGSVLNTVLTTALPIASDGLRMTEECASLQPQYLCGLVVSLAIEVAQSAVGTGEAIAFNCISGANSTCAEAFSLANDITRTAENVALNCVNMTPGTTCPSTIQTVLDELDSLESLVTGATAEPTITTPTLPYVFDDGGDANWDDGTPDPVDVARQAGGLCGGASRTTVGPCDPYYPPGDQLYVEDVYFREPYEFPLRTGYWHGGHTGFGWTKIQHFHGIYRMQLLRDCISVAEHEVRNGRDYFVCQWNPNGAYEEYTFDITVVVDTTDEKADDLPFGVVTAFCDLQGEDRCPAYVNGPESPG